LKKSKGEFSNNKVIDEAKETGLVSGTTWSFTKDRAGTIKYTS